MFCFRPSDPSSDEYRTFSSEHIFIGMCGDDDINFVLFYLAHRNLIYERKSIEAFSIALMPTQHFCSNYAIISHHNDILSGNVAMYRFMTDNNTSRNAWMAFISLIVVLFFFIHHELCKKNWEKFHFNTFGANKLNHNCESMNAETELSETFERCGLIKAFRLMFNDQIGEKFIDFFTIIFFGSKYILVFFLLGQGILGQTIHVLQAEANYKHISRKKQR